MFSLYNPYGEPYGMSRQQRYDNILNGGTYSTQPNQPPMNNIIWVQGEAGAKAFQIPPNSNIILMDNDDLVLYVKSTDNVGLASTRAFRLTEIVNETPNNLIAQKTNINNINNVNYVTREEFEQLKGMVENAQSNFYANANTTNANEKYPNNSNRQKSNDK